jgi:hypothetical protein
MRNVKRSVTSVVIALAVVCGACTYTYQEKAKQIEPMLSAAGFKMKLADTPEKLAKLQAMPQLKFRTLARGGKTYYAYTDVEGCRCTYLGNRSAYESYQSLLQQQQMVEQDREEANVNEDAAIVENDAMWESWGFDVW